MKHVNFNQVTFKISGLALAALALFAVTSFVVQSLSDHATAANKPRGATLVFNGGATVYMANCDMEDFDKLNSAGDDRTLSRVCGGGTESLSRINISNVVAICPGNCR